MASSHFVLGGARSGKSRLALAGVPRNARVAFVATAQAGDGDMAARIARHRAERPRGWLTIEEPFELVPRLSSLAREADCVVVNCVTVWVANLLLRGDRDADILAAGDRLAALAAQGAFDLTLVSNEVGGGVATGEMGIGNTTAAAAITAAITGLPPEAVTGRGTGINEAVWRRKIEVVGAALRVNRPDGADGLDVLAKVGGFEIAGLVGVILGGVARSLPVVIDGFISTAAALVAVTLAPEARHALFASHRSAEPGHGLALAHLGLVPYLDLSLRLGEGTGAALFIHLARAAALVYAEMATFKSAGVDGPR